MTAKASSRRLPPAGRPSKQKRGTGAEVADLIPLVGEAYAVRSYRPGLEAIDNLEALVRDLGDDCG